MIQIPHERPRKIGCIGRGLSRTISSSHRQRTLHDIRDALNHELVLGRSYFKDKIEEMAKRQTRLGQPGRPRIEEEEAVYYVLG